MVIQSVMFCSLRGRIITDSNELHQKQILKRKRPGYIDLIITDSFNLYVLSMANDIIVMRNVGNHVGTVYQALGIRSNELLNKNKNIWQWETHYIPTTLHIVMCFSKTCRI